MKTYRNRDPQRHLLLIRDWDEDTGLFSYSQRLLTGEALAELRAAESAEDYFGFSSKRDLLPHRDWYGLIPPAGCLVVETFHETFAQCAMRTGDFSRCQPRRSS